MLRRVFSTRATYGTFTVYKDAAAFQVNPMKAITQEVQGRNSNYLRLKRPVRS